MFMRYQFPKGKNKVFITGFALTHTTNMKISGRIVIFPLHKCSDAI